MESCKILASSVLLICLAVLMVGQASAAALSIPVFPLSEEMRDLPIRVYWMDGVCAPEQRKIIKDGVNIALGVLAGGASVLAGEYPEGFAGFEFFRFMMISTAESAQIIVTDANIGTTGKTTLLSLGGRIVPPVRVELGCDLASIGIDAVVTIALHELGHALGLGHADFEEYNGVKELMYPVARQFMYPSTLDLYAIYLLVIKGYSGSSISLPEWLPYAQVSPQSLVYPEIAKERVAEEEAVAVAELEKRLNELSNKLSSLENKVISLEDDIQVIERRIGELEERVGALENSTLDLIRWANETEAALEMCFKDLSRLNESILQLSEALTGQSRYFDEKITELIMSLENLRGSLNEAHAKWSENFKTITERQNALEEKLRSQEERIQVLYERSRQMSSRMEELRLRISELEESLEERDLQIARLQSFGMILSIMLAATLAIAIAGLIQASRARKIGIAGGSGNDQQGVT